jgi:polysaccharide pyruvyl transferase WcaK-like protein/2-polyprenyl-3-methyl-5-hydroxy-6-metoxy-1,4-benzoquinol methylase
MVITTNCHFCNSTDFKFISSDGDKFDGEQSNICMNCGLVFLSPRMADDELEEYYFGGQFSRDFRSGVVPDKKKQKDDLARAQERWNVLRDILPKEGKLLDIGCSWGAFLKSAPDGIDAYGIDPSVGYVEYAQSLGLDATIGHFPDDTTEIYDIISIFHVLEHVPDVIGFLQAVYDRLSENGRLVLEYPDIGKAALFRPYIRANYYQRSHLYDFSYANLLPVLEGLGFYLEYSGDYGKVFPQDKNMLLIARKDDARSEHIFNSLFAEELYKLLDKKAIPFHIAKSSPLDVLHIASHNINMGDGAISAGIRRMVETVVGTPTRFTAVDIVDYKNYGQHFSAEQINEIKPDLVLIGGGGTIDGHPHREHTGTAFSMPFEEFDKIQAPVGLMGLGHNIFPNQEVYHMDTLEEFVLLCKSKGYPFSVRRDGSWERLSKELGGEAMSHIQRIPDPGFFVPVDTGHFTPEYVNDGRKNIILQIALDAYSHRFGGEDVHEERIGQFTDDIRRYASRLVTEFDSNIIFAIHTLADHVALVHLFSTTEQEPIRFNFRSTGLGHPLNAFAFYNTYAKADLVVGMRGHSVICSTGLGVPSIAISTHDKIKGFMEEVGISSDCLYPVTSDFEDLLIVKTEELLENPQRQLDDIQKATTYWHKEFAEFLYQCLEQI